MGDPQIITEDLKFILTWVTAVVFLWRAASWVARKYLHIENFFSDVRDFMKVTSGSLHRMETNHMKHQEQYLKAIAKHSGADVELEDDSDAIPE